MIDYDAFGNATDPEPMTLAAVARSLVMLTVALVEMAIAAVLG